MSAPIVTLQGNQLSVGLRLTGVGSYLQVVCTSDVSIKNTAPTSVTQTNCAPLLSWGQATWTGTINAVFNSNCNPTVQMSLNQAYQWFSGTTGIPQLLDIEIEYPSVTSAGSTFFVQGQCIISDISETWSTNELVKFTLSLTGNGILTQTGS